MDDKVLKRQEAIISSMTKQERKKPAVLNASRRKRIAAGSGTTVQEVNRVLKMHKQMAGMMKKMSKKGGMKGMMAAMGQAGVSPTDLAKMGGAPEGTQLPGLGGPGMGGPLQPNGLPGLGGGSLPGLGGKKK